MATGRPVGAAKAVCSVRMSVLSVGLYRPDDFEPDDCTRNKCCNF